MTAAAIFGSGVAAQASTYPPTEAPGVEVSGGVTADGTTGGTLAGGTFDVTFSGCAEDENVTATYEDQTQTEPCQQPQRAGFMGRAVELTNLTGSVTFTFRAGSTPGIFTGTATGDRGYRNTFSITVITVISEAPAAPVTPVTPAAPTSPLGGLPATGSYGISTMSMMAIGFFIVGGGLLVVTQLRRHQTVPA